MKLIFFTGRPSPSFFFSCNQMDPEGIRMRQDQGTGHSYRIIHGRRFWDIICELGSTTLVIHAE